MVSQRRLLNLLTLLILISLFAVACERPLGGTDDGATDDQTAQTDDANAGGGTDGSVDTTTDGAADTTTDATGDTATDSNTAADDTATDTTSETTTDTGSDTTTDAGDTTQDDSAEAGGGAGDATTDTAADTTATDESAAEETTTEDTTANETSTTTASTIPATHTVAAGENLYRIGLKYGISWAAIANANNLANPNILSVGQVLNLPGGTTTDPGPTPSPQTETTYVVQTGDNLFRIGLKFGISWVQIAEANGLVNPNVIKAGDELKIPVDAPGPAPAFSHVVKAGETLFLISLQYGVSWPSIAEANNLTSPYIIYVGQTLEIPGS